MLQNKITAKYERKEWMHPEDMDLKNPSNLVLFLKHLKAYEHVLQATKNKSVLEIGCGSGYGNRLLAERAKHIATVDIDKEALEFAKKYNPSPNIEYIHANITKGTPLPESSCDICVCFQVIEHIELKKMESFLNEIRRIVKPGGDIYFTTPNRKIRLYPFQSPANKYHVTEYTRKGLEKLLSSYFPDIKIYGLQAIDKLKQIEFNRSKKSFVNSFIIKKIKSFLKLFGVTGPLLPRKNREIDQQITDRNEFTTSNFWYDESVPDDSIGLLARCRNK